MIQVCLKDGFVVYEFASVDEFKEAFPMGLDADAIASGCFVQFVQGSLMIRWTDRVCAWVQVMAVVVGGQLLIMWIVEFLKWSQGAM